MIIVNCLLLSCNVYIASFLFPSCIQKIPVRRDEDSWFHPILPAVSRSKGRRPGDLLSFRPSRSGMQFSHLICIRFHYPDSLCHIQKTYSFLHRSYYGQELMFIAVSVKLMECRSGNSDEKQAACDSPCQVVDFSGYHFSHRLSLLFCIFLNQKAPAPVKGREP